MSKTFTYKEENKQGWLVEKPEMEKPKLEDYQLKVGSREYQEDMEGKHGRLASWQNICTDNYHTHLDRYNEHLTTLRRFKYDYPDPKKEMELGKDFEVKDSTEGWTREYYPNGEVKRLEQVAIPITQRTYSEQEVEALKKQYYDSGLMAERIIWKDKVEKLCKEAYTDARTLYHNVMVQDWWPEFKLHNNL